MLLLCFCCIAGLLIAQKTPALFKRCPVKTLNYEQGLANNTTTDIITDEYGFSWISTRTGLQRYNGYSFETIYPADNKRRININSPVHFFELNNGLIWISYKQGILEYNPQTNIFKKIVAVKDSGAFNFPIIPVLQNTEGIYCLQHNKGLVLYSVYGNVKNIFAPNDAFIQNIFNMPVESLVFSVSKRNGLIFIYNGRDEIEQLNIHTKKKIYIPVSGLLCLTATDRELYLVSNASITIRNLDSNYIEASKPFKFLQKKTLALHRVL